MSLSLLWQIPSLFVRSLFDPTVMKPAPEEPAAPSLTRQIKDIWKGVQKEGIVSYMTQRPLCAVQAALIVSGAGSAHLGSSLGEGTQMVLALAQTVASTVQQAGFLYDVSKSIPTPQTTLQKVVKVVAGAWGVYWIASLPLAAASSYGDFWHSWRDVSLHYENNRCSPTIRAQMGDVLKCIQQRQGDFDNCQHLINRTVFKEEVFTLFSKHPSKSKLDPFSIMRPSANTTCFMLSFTTNYPLVELCFSKSGRFLIEKPTKIFQAVCQGSMDAITPKTSMAALEVRLKSDRECLLSVPVNRIPRTTFNLCFPIILPEMRDTRLCFNRANLADHIFGAESEVEVSFVPGVGYTLISSEQRRDL
jgi:hypothetical protein